MTDTPYQPVSCQLHSEIELMAMQARHCEIMLKNHDLTLTGVIKDVTVHDKAEFLQLEVSTSESINLRLDHIQQIKAL